MTQRRNNSKTRAAALPPAGARLMVSLIIPPLIGLILLTVSQRLFGVASSGLGSLATLFSGIGLASLYLGLNWYGTAGTGLRGKRPFFAGAGFAFLGWIVLLIARFMFVSIDESAFLQDPLLPSFFYLLLFEAFALQLWTFGLLFRSAADWRGPLTAAVVSGLLFAAVGYITFLESFQANWSAALYFLAWGVFYGIVRLRTGSLIGIVLVQAMQSLTGWFLLPPVQPVMDDNFNLLFYTVMGIWYLILIWRLWPKEVSDYRV